jgi:hypothetical protein
VTVRERVGGIEVDDLVTEDAWAFDEVRKRAVPHERRNNERRNRERGAPGVRGVRGHWAGSAHTDRC